MSTDTERADARRKGMTLERRDLTTADEAPVLDGGEGLALCVALSLAGWELAHGPVHPVPRDPWPIVVRKLTDL